MIMKQKLACGLLWAITSIIFLSLFSQNVIVGQNINSNVSLSSELPIDQINRLWDRTEKKVLLKSDSAFLLINEGMRVAEKAGHDYWIAKFTLLKGENYYQHNDYDSAILCVQKSLHVFDSLQISSELAFCHSKLGLYKIFKHDYFSAEQHFGESISISGESSDNRNLALTYSYFGFLKYYMSDLDQSLDYYLKSLEYSQILEEPDFLRMAENSNVIGSIYSFQGDYFNAMDAFRKSLEYYTIIDNKRGVAYALNNIALMNREVEYFDRALTLHQEALELRKALNDTLEIVYSLFDIGNHYKDQNKSEKALSAFKEGLQYCRDINDDYFIHKVLAAIAEVYADQGRLDLAWEYFARTKRTEPPIIELKLVSTKLLILEKKWSEAILPAVEVMKQAEAQNLLKLKHEALEYLLDAHSALGNYQEAFELSLVKQTISDSLSSERNSIMTRRLSYEFQEERKEVELSALEKQSEIQQIQIKSQRYLLYLFVLLGLLATAAALGFYYISMKSRQIAKKEGDLRNATMNLFANISHELRTPLSIIRIPLERMYKGEFKGDTTYTRKIMLDNVQQLTNLVDQILDLSRLKERQAQLNLIHDDPLELLRVIVGQFSSFAHQKNLKLELKFPSNSWSIYYDEEVWGKILSNLISNALKFTKNGGVRIELEYLTQDAVLKVIDSGPGIPQEILPHIFDRFYRNPMTQHQNLVGGLGLSLVKELVDVCKGSISVESIQDVGTTFKVVVPHGIHIPEDEIPNAFEVLHFNEGFEEERNSHESIDQIQLALNPAPTHFNGNLVNPRKILIIEDNIDLNTLITNYLSEEYKVYQAYDGMEGFDIAQKVIPDLILTDIMMPKMDGMDLAKKLHTSLETSHIPLIVISALNDRILNDGYWKSGIVDFVQKPIDMERLLFKINGLIESRDQFRKLIKNKPLLELVKDVPVTDKDKDFLDRLHAVLIEYMADEEFNIDKLSQIMLVSRMQLFRKVKSLTGMTPVKYIQKIKMQFAFDLLTEKRVDSVTQVALSVGYSNLSFFSRKFKEVYGTNAIDIIRKGRTEKI